MSWTVSNSPVDSFSVSLTVLDSMYTFKNETTTAKREVSCMLLYSINCIMFVYSKYLFFALFLFQLKIFHPVLDMKLKSLR